MNSSLRNVLTVYLLLNVQTLTAQTSAFTYQGRLNDNGTPANGNYDLQFALKDAASAGNTVSTPITVAPVAASNGVFTVTLDFTASAFTGAARWLEIGVRTNGSGSPYTTLTPRQPITSTPYAVRAISATTATTATTASSVVNGAIGPTQLAAGAATANLLASGQAGVASGASFFLQTRTRPASSTRVM